MYCRNPRSRQAPTLSHSVPADSGVPMRGWVYGWPGCD